MQLPAFGSHVPVQPPQTTLPEFNRDFSQLMIGLAWAPVLIVIVLFLSGPGAGISRFFGVVGLLLLVGLGYALWYSAILLFWLFLAFLAIRFIKAAWSW